MSTSNGQDESHVHIPSPRRPRSSRSTRTPGSWCGKTTRSRTASCTGSGRRRRSARSAACFRSSPLRATAGCAATKPQSGKKLWEFDTNPKDAVWPRTRNELIATPVIYKERVYIGNGQDPEHGEGVGHFYAIDATKRGDITQTGRLWHFDKIRRIDFHRGDRRRPGLCLGFQRLSALPRREDRPGVLAARHARRRLGFAVSHRRQGLPRRRRRRRRCHGAQQREEASSAR